MGPAEIIPLYTQNEIKTAVSRLADKIREDYRGKRPLLLGILKGSFIFMADLVRALNIPVEIDFVRLSSYGSGTTSSGQVKMAQDFPTSVEGKDVLVVEDIVDSGLTLSFFLNYLRERKPASLKVCTLIDKTYRRELKLTLDYVGFRIHDQFVVGYGLDFDEKYRNLPDICVLRRAPDDP